MHAEAKANSLAPNANPLIGICVFLAIYGQNTKIARFVEIQKVDFGVVYHATNAQEL